MMKLIEYRESMVLIIYTKNASKLRSGSEWIKSVEAMNRQNGRTHGHSQNYILPNLWGDNQRKEENDCRNIS